jgi:hypothetical protein
MGRESVTAPEVICAPRRSPTRIWAATASFESVAVQNLFAQSPGSSQVFDRPLPSGAFPAPEVESPPRTGGFAGEVIAVSPEKEKQSVT